MANAAEQSLRLASQLSPDTELGTRDTFMLHQRLRLAAFVRCAIQGDLVAALSRRERLSGTVGGVYAHTECASASASDGMQHLGQAREACPVSESPWTKLVVNRQVIGPVSRAAQPILSLQGLRSSLISGHGPLAWEQVLQLVVSFSGQMPEILALSTRECQV
jgi:hypothetical protein